MVPDRTGRFPERPHFTPDELDRDCERIVLSFLLGRRGEVRYPIDTDDLHVLIEQHDARLDSSTDLSGYGADVEGLAEFFPDRTPLVSISERLASDPRRENRLRTTLTHEFGHVCYHGPLWAERFRQGNLFERSDDDNKVICKRGNILNEPQADWMEWQAGYVSGAALMPVSRVRQLVSGYCAPRELHGSVFVDSDHGRALIGAVMEEFAVSEEAARIRLLKLSLLVVSDNELPLF